MANRHRYILHTETTNFRFTEVRYRNKSGLQYNITWSILERERAGYQHA